MKSLLWKEYLEHRILCIILGAYGIIALAVMNYFRYLDSGTAVFVLLIFSGPIFTVMMGTHLMANEITNNTFPFLAGLPISRWRIWVGKVSFGALFALGMYTYFSGLLLATDVMYTNSEILSKSSKIFSDQIGVFIFLGMPMTALAFGMFLTVLPKIPALIFGGLFMILIWAGFLSFTVYNVNLFCLLASLGFFWASWKTFQRGELMDTWKTGILGTKAFLVMAIFCFSAWGGLDLLADQVWDIRHLQLGKIFVENDSSVIITGKTVGNWWDPIRNHELPYRMLRLNTQTGGIEPIGGRLTLGHCLTSDKRFMAVTSARNVWGNALINKLYIVDLFDKNNRRYVDEMAFPLGFTDNKTLIYQRFGGTIGKMVGIMELCRYEIGSGTQVIRSVEKDQYQYPVFLNSINQIFLNAKGEKSSPVLVDLQGGAKKLMNDRNIVPLMAGSTFHLFKFSGASQEKDAGGYFLIDSTGKVTMQPWIPLDMSFIGSLPDGRVIGKRRVGSFVKGATTETVEVLSLNFTDNTVQSLQKIDQVPVFFSWKAFDPGKGWLIVEKNPGQGQNEIWQYDLLNGSSKKLEPGMTSITGLVSAGAGVFLASNEQQSVWRWDLNTPTYREIFTIK